MSFLYLPGDFSDCLLVSLFFPFSCVQTVQSVSVPAHVGPHEGEVLPWKGFSEIENSETWRQGGGMEK